MLLTRTLTTLFILVAVSTHALAERDYEFKIDAIWKNTQDVDGKQYLAVLDEDSFTAEDGSFIIYGEKRGKISVRTFPLGLSFPYYVGHERTVKDDFYTVKVAMTSDNEIEVHMKGRLPGYDYKMTYTKITDAQEFKTKTWEANRAVYKIYDEYQELVYKNEPDSIAELKKLVYIHNRSYWYYPNDYNDYTEKLMDYQFEGFWDQIEAEITITDANKNLAAASIRKNGKDIITKTFNPDKTWFDGEIEDPEDYEAEFIEDLNSGVIDDIPTIWTYSDATALADLGLKDGNIKRGINKFLKYTITAQWVWECEGSYDWDYSFTWLLTDGSAIQYSPGLECD